MNFSELKTEFFARGTDYLSEDGAGVTRAERWINQAYREICNIQVWPFLVANTTGTASAGLVSIPDLRKVLLVQDTESSRVLRKATYDELVDVDGEVITTTGTPFFYWIDAGNLVKAHPVGGTIFARYVKRVAPLTGTDEPLFDEEYHDLIIDRAMIKAYKDSDNFEAAAALKVEFDSGLSAMAEDYLLDTREVSYISVSPYDG